MYLHTLLIIGQSAEVIINQRPTRNQGAPDRDISADRAGHFLRARVLNSEQLILAFEQINFCQF